MSAISILAQVDTMSLENGMELRLLSAWELLGIRREALELSQSEEDYPLCLNACLISFALEVEGKALFQSGAEVLKGLCVEEIANLARRWGEFNRQVNPSPTMPMADVEELKKN